MVVILFFAGLGRSPPILFQIGIKIGLAAGICADAMHFVTESSFVDGTATITLNEGGLSYHDLLLYFFLLARFDSGT
jgi:hypothetical protein